MSSQPSHFLIPFQGICLFVDTVNELLIHICIGLSISLFLIINNHPSVLYSVEVEKFLTYLAVEQHVASSTQKVMPVRHEHHS